MTNRRLPRWKEIRPLIGSSDKRLTPIQRRLARCADVADVRVLAKSRVPRAVFDYTDGAAGQEISLERSLQAYASVEFHPRVLRDVSTVDTSVQMLGKDSALPFAFAPTGFTRMMHHIGEPAVARVAAEYGIPYALSTLGTTSPESLAESVPNSRRWFQLYVWRDRDASAALIERAKQSGFDTLILTVDTAVGGIRLRDIRNGLTIPPNLSLRTLSQMALYPRWWANLLTTTPLEFASLTSSGGTVGDLLTKVFDPTITPEDLSWLRGIWNGHILVKGVQHQDDVKLLQDLGADGVVLSNHGGRQIDRGNVPLELLPQVVDSVRQDFEVYVDGGIRSGSDIVAALALGARGVLIGRAYLYGLMAGGEDGVRRVVEILSKEVRTTMQLLGATSVRELNRDLLTLRRS